MSDEQKIQPAAGPPVGYNPIAEIRGAYFHWLLVPFFADRGGKSVWCKCRCLNAIQLEACGNLISLILPEDSSKPKTKEDAIKMYNAMERVCQETLVEPTFDEIISDLINQDCRIEEKKKLLAELEKEINSDRKMATSEKDEYQKKIDKLNLEIGFLLPHDTMGFLVNWAHGVEVTDIKKLTKEILLNAAFKTIPLGKLPHEVIFGIFTDKQMGEIDSKSIEIYNEFQEDKKRELELSKKGRVIRGSRKAK